MFPEMRRKKQVLDNETCQEILRSEKRGVLAVNGNDGYPYAIPMNFYYDPEKNAVYLHTALSGHKVDAISKDDKVCFTTWNKGVQKEDWSYHVDSVVCFGRAHQVKDQDELMYELKQFGMKYYPTEAEVDIEIDRDLSRMLFLRIDIEHMTGKHVHER